MLPIKYQNNIEEELNRLWSYWRGLGVFSNGDIMTTGMEEAFIGLCVFGRFDQRLYDEGISVIISYLNLLSLNKLKFWFNKLDPLTRDIFIISSELVFHKSGDSKLFKITDVIKNREELKKLKPRPFFYSPNGEPMYSTLHDKGFFNQKKWLRNDFNLSARIPGIDKISRLNPWIKSKLTFGNGVIADTVVLISSIDFISAPDISQRTGYTGKSIWLVLRNLENAGWLTSKKNKNKIIYSLSESGKKIFKAFKTSDPYFKHFKRWIELGFYIDTFLKLPPNASMDLIRSEELRVNEEIPGWN